MKLFVAHKMTQNNTLNKVHVAATATSADAQLFGEATAQMVTVRLCARLKLTDKKIKLLEVEGARTPMPVLN